MTYDEVEQVIQRGDPEEMVRVIRVLWGFVEMTKRPTRKPRVQREEPKATWMTTIAEAYEAQMGAGTFPYGKAAPEMKKLVDAGWSPEEVSRRLAFYLRRLERADDIRFLSFPRFRMTFKDHDPSTPAFEE